jgi:threonine/homoserine/homoserine lactone efflux protein
MTSELNIAALLAVGAITPGPNNMIVMSAAHRGGWSAALRSILGVMSGSLALLLICCLSLRAASHANPVLFNLCTIGGSLYLAWLGSRLAWGADIPSALIGSSLTPKRLIFIQAANPKAWIMTATVAAAAAGTGWHGIGVTALIMIAITGACLSLWALAGGAFAQLLTSQKAGRRVDQVMGVALVGTALMVAAPAIATYASFASEAVR